MDMSWLGKVVPTVATALGGPLAGMAAEFVSKKLGLDSTDVDEVNKVLQGGKLTSDQIAQLQQAEIELKAKAQEMGIRFEDLAVEDRKSAREMQTATRSFIPGSMAVAVTAGFFGILWMLMTGEATKSDALMLMLGSLGTAWTSIIAFYFGSSAGSQDKDHMIYNSTPSKQP